MTELTRTGGASAVAWVPQDDGGGPSPSPPLTFAAVRRRWPALLPLAVILPLALGVVAAVGGGHLLIWDQPITDAAVAHRTPGLDAVALAVSRLGSWVVVFPVGLALAALASVRSRRLATVMLVTIMARPLVEWTLKEIVARPRPTGARLVAGTGFSYPSGHVLAAAATWAFLPPVVALLTRRRAWWWVAVAVSGALVVLVAWSRVWLGVHWTSDVVASLCLAYVALTAIEARLSGAAPVAEGGGDRSVPTTG
jgi:undecaprenyl-diphosphatase